MSYDALTKTDGSGQPEHTAAVADIIALQNIPEELKKDLLNRLAMGEKKYGHKLKMDWKDAKKELYQELLDGYAYALSARDDAAIHIILAALRRFHV